MKRPMRLARLMSVDVFSGDFRTLSGGSILFDTGKETELRMAGRPQDLVDLQRLDEGE